jgi:hypothetical protein
MNNFISTSKWCISLTLAVILGLATAANAATVVDPDTATTAILSQIDKSKYPPAGQDNYDALSGLSKKLRTYLLSPQNQVALMQSRLQKAQGAGLYVAESPDRKLRVYSWDKWTGGTMHFFDATAQYKTLSGKAMPYDFGPVDDTDNGAYYDKIVPVRTKSGRTVYLVFGTSIGSTICYTLSVASYEITRDGKLIKAPFFKTKKQFLNEISCGVERQDTSLDCDIELTNANKTLRIPVVDESMHFKSSYLIYKFDGEKFVYVGVKAE